ncbi:ABC transporter ATP-binding protein [Permianibacter aggregans]|uniref:Putative ABC transport system ATP-binding protein n=1 Tax=Permianibacter aggregans TaxID=1510150 RepID=A0A4R6UMJ9_9GAMM|nr:ABC transporter ATP-binding protein [Permianibacter aggregans]QGX40863.1 ABC transporter ATP-binding protein [Permianibacter aggregans]TDQ48318.1 putative ABC transport system ATP-binding protein [Permianibacter aggregans]
MNEAVVRMNAVSKTFLTDEIETLALNNIELSINRGEFVAITGPSGCGKSTLLSVIGLLDTASSGEYQLQGEAVHNLNNRERARKRNRDIGFVFQAFNLISDLSVAENVALPLSYRDDLSKAERQNRVQQMLEKVDMQHRAKHYPAQLSGGQQQRVAIARALAGNPGLLLADEPTGNLDSRNAEMVMRLLQQMHREGSTIVMVTHDPHLAALANRQIALFDGRIVNDSRANAVAA